MATFYYDPDEYGLETIGEIDWSSGSYEFDYTVVWRRTSDGAFLYGEDSGCSCPSPFEDTGVNDLTPIASLAEFQAHLADRNDSGCDGTRDVEIAELLERLRAAGLPAGGVRMTDADLHAILRDVADRPRRLTTTAAILLATLASLTLWGAAAWLAVTW